jgi:hypothetical protein
MFACSPVSQHSSFLKTVSMSDRKNPTLAQQGMCTVPWSQFKFHAASPNEAGEPLTVHSSSTQLAYCVLLQSHPHPPFIPLHHPHEDRFSI